MTLADYQQDKVQLIVNDGKNTVIAYSESVELSNNKVNVDEDIKSLYRQDMSIEDLLIFTSK